MNKESLKLPSQVSAKEQKMRNRIEIRLTNAQKVRINYLHKYEGIAISKIVRGLLDTHLGGLLGQTSLLSNEAQPVTLSVSQTSEKLTERLEIQFNQTDKQDLQKVSIKLNISISDLIRGLIQNYLMPKDAK